MTPTLLFASILAAWTAGDPPENVPAVLTKYESIRPREKDLAIYRLDWAPTLKDAKTRAAKEGRPVFLMVVTNSFGNLYTGNC